MYSIFCQKETNNFYLLQSQEVKMPYSSFEFRKFRELTWIAFWQIQLAPNKKVYKSWYENLKTNERLESFQDEVGEGEGRPNVVQVPISVIVLDENDNAPVFRGVPYKASVNEDTPVGTTVFQVCTTTTCSCHQLKESQLLFCRYWSWLLTGFSHFQKKKTIGLFLSWVISYLPFFIWCDGEVHMYGLVNA